jgi:hypothetical protein
MHGDFKRAVIVLHPDFNLPGADGVTQAKAFAEQLLASQSEFLSEIQKHQTPDVVRQIRNYQKNLRVVVRKIPAEIL